jgi:hypothetical protein
MHIIATAHQALSWDNQRTDGVKPDATRNFKHYFDLCFHAEKTVQGTNVTRTFTVVKSNYQHILPIGTKIVNPTWDDPRIQRIINDETVAIVSVPPQELIALHAKAGKPDGTIGAWLTANRFELIDRKLSPEDSHRAKGILEELIAEQTEQQELGATA